jgi:hypothetical protein
MYNLPNGPTAVAIGSFNLLWGKILNRGAQCRRGLFDVVDEFVSLRFAGWAVELEFANGITGIAHLRLRIDYRSQMTEA